MVDVQNLEFPCIECEKPVTFSALGAESSVRCTHCGRHYAFDDHTLLGHLRQFESLCRQLQASEAILSNAGVAVDVGGHEVRIPFRLLLTRLNSVISLEIDGKGTEIRFRVDPSREVCRESAGVS